MFFKYRKHSQNKKNVKNAKHSNSVKTAQNCNNLAKMLSCHRQESRDLDRKKAKPTVKFTASQLFLRFSDKL